MAGRLQICRSCGLYTMQAKCPRCKGGATTPHPARFSPEDRHGEYRRRLKRLTAAESGVGRRG